MVCFGFLECGSDLTLTSPLVPPGGRPERPLKDDLLFSWGRDGTLCRLEVDGLDLQEDT